MKEVTASDILKEYVDGNITLVEVFNNPFLGSEDVMGEVLYYLEIIAEYEDRRWSGDTW